MQVTIDAGDWPAWIQAVGSIAAIGVAILVTRHESKLQRDLRQEELDRMRNDAAAKSRVHRKFMQIQLITPLIVLDVALKNASVTVAGQRHLGDKFDGRQHLGFAEIEHFEGFINRLEGLPEPDALALIDLISTLRGYRAAFATSAKTPGGLASLSNESITTLLDLAEKIRAVIREVAKRFDIPLPG